MKFNKLLILGFLLIALVALPVSFAADISVTDLNPNDVGVTDLSLKEVNQSISSTSLEEDVSSFDTSSLLDNETVYLNESYTGNDEKGTLENPYKNINNATNALLSSNKTNLFIANGNYIINNHFDVDSKNINIIGESASGVTINCNNTTYIQFINSNSNICDLTIYNSYSTDEDAVIWTELSNITMCNVVFTNNLANSPGGIILTRGGTFKLINSSIKNNLIDYGNGGISGGIIYSDNNVIIINSSFVNNTIKSSTYFGGAIFASGNLEFINSTVSELYVVSNEIIQGAFIYYEQLNNDDYAHIINSSFQKSNFEYVSGLILTNARNCIINNVNISDNYAKYLQGNISVLDTYYNSYIENLNIFNNTYDDVSISLSTVMNFLYRDGYFNISEPLPDKYDLREYNLTTSVKNQNPLGTCWAFAAIGALESYLLKNWNETFDLSENNMKNIMGKNGINGSEWDVNKGGNDVLALAYLLRWSGAVNESDDPYLSSDIAKIYDAVCHVQDVIYIPLRFNYTDNDQIKYAIFKYGAVWTEMNAEGFSINTYSPDCKDSNHAVAIVGWDDNYSADNFDIAPPGDGAFIVKNSWGPSWGDGGYFYVSYYDASFAGFASDSKFSGFVFSNVEKVDNYDSIYYYDPFGNDYVAAGYLSNTGWFANQFVSNDKEILSAFGIYTYGDSNYTANIYVNEELVYTQEGAIYNSGYHTIKLNKQLGLNKGDLFKIEIKLTTPNCLYPIAVEVPHMGDKPFVNATANPNESFVSVDGVTWDDLTDLIENANVCIKAYTVNPNYVIEVNETEIEAYVDDEITLKVIVKDLSGIIKDLSNGNISVIFPDSTVVIPTVVDNEINFTIPNTNVSGIVVIKFETSDYPTIFANLNLSLIKHITHLDVSLNESIYVGDECSFIINITDENNGSVEGNVLIYDNGVQIVNLVVNGSVLWNYAFNSSGKHIISVVYEGNNKYVQSNISKNITVNKIPVSMTIKQNNTYYKSAFITITLSKAINGQKITLKFSNGKTATVSTNSKGVVTYYVPFAVGSYKVTATASNNYYNFDSVVNKAITIKKVTATITAYKLTTTYKSGKYFQVKVTNPKGQVMVGVKLKLKVYTGKKYKTVSITTGTNGIAKYSGSSLSIAKHKIIVSSAESTKYMTASSKTNYLTVKKGTTTVTAPVVKNKYKKSQYFKVTIKNKASGKLISGLYLKIKVYTGKKYKTYKVKTNSKGIAYLNTKALSKGSHKVVISTTSKYYSVSKSGYLIKIVK